MGPETAQERETRELYSAADDLLEQARARLRPEIEELRRIAEVAPRYWSDTDRKLVVLALRTMVTLLKLGRF